MGETDQVDDTLILSRDLALDGHINSRSIDSLPNEFGVHSVAPDFALVSAILYLGRDWQFQCTSDKSRVAGNLKRHIEFWKKIQAFKKIRVSRFRSPPTLPPSALKTTSQASSTENLSTPRSQNSYTITA